MTQYKLDFGARAGRVAARRRSCGLLYFALCVAAAAGCEDDAGEEVLATDAAAVLPPLLDASAGDGAGGSRTFDASPRGPEGAADLRGGSDAAGGATDAASAPAAGGGSRGGGRPDGGPMRDAAQGTPEGGAPQPGRKYVGNITTRNQVRPDFGEYWDQITPENEGKWESVERERNEMVWDGLDRAHDYARQHGLTFKQHTMVWGSQQPTWLAGLSAADQRKEVEEWIRLFCERYPDVDEIDVVNEPPTHTTPVYAAALGGAGSSGYDWIVQAFKWTRQYCPNATLILNDYNNIEYGADSMRFISIVNAIKAAGAPIDAVGAQAHDAYKLSTETVKMFLDRLASQTGLPVYISEYDIDVADDARQQQIMQSQFTMFWNHPQVRGITLWGYVSGATWRPNTGLMSSTGSERPALRWLREFLAR
jgi:endo-1,4-beta-xylanase